jgi:hypothetical protein
MKVITIGKRLVPSEQIAFVELFDPSSNPDFQAGKEFKGRVVLLNREIVLTEQTLEKFAAENEFHLLAEDNVAVNPTIRFKVETFEPTESFNPSRPFQTRLKWRDLAGDEQSKLLLTAPDTVIAEILKAKKLRRPAKRPERRPVTLRSRGPIGQGFRPRHRAHRRSGGCAIVTLRLGSPGSTPRCNPFDRDVIHRQQSVIR